MNDHDEPLDPLAPADAKELHAANALREALEARAGGAEAPSGALEAAALLRSSGPAGRLSDERRAALRGALLTDLEAARGRRGGTQVTARAGLRRWLTLLLPLTGGTAALIVLALFRWQGADESSMSRPSSSGATVPEGQPGAWAAPSVSSASVSSKAAPRGGREDVVASAAKPPGEPLAAAPSAAALGRLASSAGAGTVASASRAQPAPADLDARLAREAQSKRAVLLPRLRDPRLNDAYAALDRAHSPSELRAVQSQLLTLTSGALGGAGVAAADGALLRQDIFCRLAETALQLGQPDAAFAWARRGLEIDAAPNVFGARLHVLAGQAQAALGDRDGAARSYSEAIEINEQLLGESLDGTP
jgi:tetratricopeptide (TPR) repeat protein